MEADGIDMLGFTGHTVGIEAIHAKDVSHFCQHGVSSEDVCLFQGQSLTDGNSSARFLSPLDSYVHYTGNCWGRQD